MEEIGDKRTVPVFSVIASVAIIAALVAATVFTDGAASCTLIGVASEGALTGAVNLGISGALIGAFHGALSYMEEYDTLDRSGQRIAEGASMGLLSGTIIGTIMGGIGGAWAQKELLEADGIEVVGGKVDLSKYAIRLN